jgi:hypothetical protein
MSFKKNKKGFIGPIGDDLPSLVPIVVALVLFFTIFTMTLNTFNTKNDSIRKQIEMTSVAREVKGDSFILNVDTFNNKCSDLALKNIPYNFMISVYSFEEGISAARTDFFDISNYGSDYASSTNILKGENEDGAEMPYYCEFKKVNATQFTDRETNYLIRYYPIAVQHKLIVSGGGDNEIQWVTIPGIMAMVVWE